MGSWATPQMKDILIYEGKEYYFTKEYLEIYPEKRPSSEIFSTALHRGYVTTFEIKDNKLFVVEIEVETYPESGWKSVFNEFFSNVDNIKADWVTGALEAGRGFGILSEYEVYYKFEISEGNIVEIIKLKEED